MVKKMNSYVDYDFYKESYGGNNVPQGSFLKFAIKASAYIDKITFGRVKKLEEIPEEVKFATCAVIDFDKKIEDDGGIISSESEGNHSVTYVSTGNETEDKKRYKEAALFLSNTGLLYRGVR